MMASIKLIFALWLRKVAFKKRVHHKIGKIFDRKAYFQPHQNLIQYWKKKMEISGVPDPEESVKWIKEHVEKLVYPNSTVSLALRYQLSDNENQSL